MTPSFESVPIGMVPGGLDDGMPVVETGASGMFGARGTVVRRDPRDAAAIGLHPLAADDQGLRVWWRTRCPGMVTSVTHGTSLDLTHPVGRYVLARAFGVRWTLPAAEFGDLEEGVAWASAPLLVCSAYRVGAGLRPVVGVLTASARGLVHVAGRHPTMRGCVLFDDDVEALAAGWAIVATDALRLPMPDGVREAKREPLPLVTGADSP